MVQGIIAGDIALRHSVEGAEDDGHAGKNEMEIYNVNKQDVVLGISTNGNTQFISCLERSKIEKSNNWTVNL